MITRVLEEYECLLIRLISLVKTLRRTSGQLFLCEILLRDLVVMYQDVDVHAVQGSCDLSLCPDFYGYLYQDQADLPHFMAGLELAFEYHRWFHTVLGQRLRWDPSVNHLTRLQKIRLIGYKLQEDHGVVGDNSKKKWWWWWE